MGQETWEGFMQHVEYVEGEDVLHFLACFWTLEMLAACVLLGYMDLMFPQTLVVPDSCISVCTC